MKRSKTGKQTVNGEQAATTGRKQTAGISVFQPMKSQYSVSISRAAAINGVLIYRAKRRFSFSVTVYRASKTAVLNYRASSGIFVGIRVAVQICLEITDAWN